MSAVQQMVLVKEQSTGMDQVKEEQEEVWTSLDGEQHDSNEETDADRFPFIAVSIKSEDDEEKPLISQLHQQQIEDRDAPTSSSADQMTAETGRGAETSRNLDLDPHEQTFESAVAEVSGEDEDEDDGNVDSELSDSGSESVDGDHDWNENPSPKSDVKTVNKSFSCPECGKQFVHKWSLQKHVRGTSHSAIRSSGCLVNKKCVKVKQRVDTCKKVKTEQKSFSCDDCGKLFTRKSSLNRHMNVHTGLKPFVCELCGQIFSVKATLNSHMRLHTGQKPFACEFCGQTFRQKSTAVKHMRIHTGQKPFACEICGQRFSQKTHLNSHMRLHTGQKPFACELCGQRFNQKTILNNHIRVHTGEKPFACELCGQKFSQKGHLNRHMRVHTDKKN